MQPHPAGYAHIPKEVLDLIFAQVPLADRNGTFEAIGATSKELRNKSTAFWGLSRAWGLTNTRAATLTSEQLPTILERISSLPDDIVPGLEDSALTSYSPRSIALSMLVAQAVEDQVPMGSVVPLVLDLTRPGNSFALCPLTANNLLRKIAEYVCNPSLEPEQARALLITVLECIDVTERDSAALAIRDVATAFSGNPQEFLASFEYLQALGWQSPPPGVLLDGMEDIPPEQRLPIYQCMAQVYAEADPISARDCASETSPRAEHPLTRALPLMNGAPEAFELARRETRRIPDESVMCCALSSVERLAIPQLDRDLQGPAFAGIMQEMWAGLRQYSDRPDEATNAERQRSQVAVDDLWQVYTDCPGIAPSHQVAFRQLQDRLPPIVS